MWMVSSLAWGLSTATNSTPESKGRNEGEISREPIKLGDDKPGLVPAASVDGAREFGAIRLLAALNLDKFTDQLPSATVKEIHHGLLLGLKPLRPWRSC
jgi:hypothetical protein